MLIADIDVEGAAFVAEKVGWLGRRATVVRCDVGSREEVGELVRRAIDWQGRVDPFFSNAGLGCGGEPHEIPDADWDRAWRVNLMSQVWGVQAVAPHMLERGSGYLVHTASASGLLGNPAIGIPAEDVAASVVEAVEGGHLYAIPHPELLDIVRGKWQDPDRWLRGISRMWREHPGILDPGR